MECEKMIKRTIISILVLVALVGLSSIAVGQEMNNASALSNETLNLSENVSTITVASNETLNLSENVSTITVASNETLNLSENVSTITVASNETLNLSENVSTISPSASDEIIELKLFGTSKTSWEDAVETAINSAEISGLRYAKVEEQNVRLEDGKIAEYTATVKLSDSEEPA
jgi:flavin-binding protein dodecin